MANLNINGSVNIANTLTIKSTNGQSTYNVAQELESRVTEDYVLENIKNSLSWVFLFDNVGGTATKTLPSGQTWSDYYELLLTVGTFGDASSNSRILASTIIPIDKISYVFYTDTSGAHQTCYRTHDGVEFNAGFNFINSTQGQLISGVGRYGRLYGRKK